MDGNETHAEIAGIGVRNAAPVYTISLSKAVATRLSAYGTLLCFLAAGVFSALTGQKELGGPSVVYVLAFFGAMAAHELVHGLCFRIFGGRPRYGAGMKYFVPYFYATSTGDVFSLSQMIIIGLAPLLTISAGSLTFAFLFPAFGDYMAVIFITNVAGAIGDLWMTGRLARFLSFEEVTVVDLADGIAVYSQDLRAREIALALYERDSTLPAFLGRWLRATAGMVVAEVLIIFIGPIFTDKLMIGPRQFPLLAFTNTERASEFGINFGLPILAGLLFALAAHLFTHDRGRSDLVA